MAKTKSPKLHRKRQEHHSWKLNPRRLAPKQQRAWINDAARSILQLHLQLSPKSLVIPLTLVDSYIQHNKYPPEWRAPIISRLEAMRAGSKEAFKVGSGAK